MKPIILALFSFFLYSFQASSERVELRDLFYEASDDGDASDKLFEKMKSVNENSLAVHIGFKGMSYLIQAKHSYNPYTKLSYFYEGRDLLESAIKKSPTNIELRFFRYIIQGNTPSFLGYQGNLKEDKALMIRDLPTSGDTDLLKRIEKYFEDQKSK